MSPAQTSRCDASALRAQAAAKTDIGLARRSNQDRFGSDDKLGIFVICDGMGGVAGGEIASRIAVEAFLETARQELASARGGSVQTTRFALQRAVAAANRAVVNRAGWDTRYRGMGTTLVAARVVGEGLTVINVGDSRAYLFRDGKAEQLTEDHSYVAEQVRRGLMTPAQAKTSSLQTAITRAIGIEADVRPDIYTAPVQPGDTLLLTSDGVTRHIAQEELAEIFAAGTQQTPEELCQRLIDLANHRGGLDNLTCIIVRVLPDDVEQQIFSRAVSAP